jgi:hypothetical protein
MSRANETANHELWFANLFRNGAQGRNRTTDTAIFSRMLYQLSYLGVLQERPKPIERAVYSGLEAACPPGFAKRLRRARPGCAQGRATLRRLAHDESNFHAIS